MPPAYPLRSVHDLPSTLYHGDALLTVQSAATYLTSFLIAALCMALLVAAFVQFLAPLTAALSQRGGWAAWRRRTVSAIGNEWINVGDSYKVPDPVFTAPSWLYYAMRELGEDKIDLIVEANQLIKAACRDLKPINRSPLANLRIPYLIQLGRRVLPQTISGVSDEQFMSGIQSGFRAALAHPSSHTPLFLMAVANESLRDVAVPLLTLDLLALRDPEAALRLGEAASTEQVRAPSPELVAASAAISGLDLLAERVSERGLDDLQRSLARLGAWYTRIVSVALGFGGTMVGSVILESRSGMTLWSIGLTAGVLAILLRDGLSAVINRGTR